MTQDTRRVVVPCTISNVGCGQNIFAFAIEIPAAEVIIKLHSDPGVDAEDSAVTSSVEALLNNLGISHGCTIKVNQKIRPHLGLGASSAGAVGAVYGVNNLLGSPFKSEELLPFLQPNETPINRVAGSLLGGFVLVRSVSPLDVITLPSQLELFCSVLVPDIDVPSELLDSMIKKSLSIEDLNSQAGNVSAMTAGLTIGREDLFAKAIEDVIGEPYRASVIPGYEKIKKAAMANGAMGCNLSGSGPAIFAISDTKKDSLRVANAMSDAAQSEALTFQLFATKIDYKGTVPNFD